MKKYLLGSHARNSTWATLRSVSATEFSSPLEPLPGLRLFRRIETTTVEDREVRTASSFDRLRVNEELPPSIFDPKAFFWRPALPRTPPRDRLQKKRLLPPLLLDSPPLTRVGNPPLR